MASRFRDFRDPEAQDALDQVPVAPERPQIDVARAQTLARSNSNPDAQRLGNAMLAADERQQAQDARQAATDQRKADVEARRQQSEQERQAKAEQARSVRAAAAAGAETVTDIETGRRTVATHPDGSVKYETGPVGAPVIQPTAEAAASSIPGMGGFMSLTRPADQQTLGQTQEVAQTYRDDSGGMVTAPLPTKTDPKTGAISSTVKDPVTGRPTEVPLGTDQAIQAKVAKDAELEQRRQALALRDNAVKQTRLQFQPKWEPVKKEFDEAGKELNAFTDPEKVKFIRDPKTGKMAKRDPNTGLPSREYVDPNELAKWQNDQADIQARHDRAKAAHDKLEPFARNLNRNETELKDAKLKLVEEKIRHDSGLPDDDGGASTILATASGEVEKPAGQQAVDEHVFPMVYAPEVLDAAQAEDVQSLKPKLNVLEKPLVPTDSPDKAKVFADAFGGLVAAGKLTLGLSGDGYQFIQRDGANIGSVDQDKHGNTFVTMGENLNGTEDLRQSVAFGTTTGVPVYLHDTAGVPRDTVKEAQYVASIFDALKDPILAQDKAMGAARLNMLDATPAAIARKVSTGELSIQHGEAIMKEVYNSTLKADDPLSPETFGKWISGADQEVKDKYTAAAKAKDTAALNAIKNDYASEWYVANRGKPGVNFKTREIAAAALTGKLRTGEKASALGGGLVEAGGSMIGMLSAPGMLAGLTVMSGIAGGQDEAYDTALADTWSNYGRASKNTWRGWELSREKWFTGEGKAKLSAFEDAQRALGATIRAQDGYRGGIEDPEWKQEYKARVDAVTDAAFAMHSMNLEDGWEVTRDDLDPSKNPGLAKLVNGYAITGDRSLLDGYFKALMEDHGTRQAQGYLADLTMGRGKFMSALISGANAPPEEIGVEIASTILTAGIGKAVFGGAKTAKLMEAGAEAATSASRMTRFRLGALGIKNEFMEAGMVADTLATPASKLGKASNFIVKGAKVSGANAVSEGLEEAAMSPADRNANADTIIKDAAMGALAGFFMGPVMAGPSVLAQSSRQAYDQNQAAKTFADSYNTANRGAEGFTPVTVEQAKTAMALAPDDVRVKLTEASKAATTNLIAAVEAAKNSTDPVVLNALSRAQAVSLITHDALATDAAMRTEAVIAIQNTDPANKDFAMALAKVASGRTDLLTGVERSAVAGKQTQDGKPYFATVQKFTPEGEAVTVDVVTDAGRAEAMQNFPQVAALIQTTESQAIFDAAQQATTPATNEQDPQGQQGTPPQDSQPAPADANASLPAGGGATAAPIQPGTGQTATPGQAPVSANAPAIKAKGESAIARAKARFPNLQARFTVDESGPTGKSAGAYARTGEVIINTSDLEAELAGYDESRHDERIDAIIDEEIKHVAQYEDARRKGKSVEEYGAELWNGFTDEQKAAALNTYQAGFEGMEDWQKGFEAVRMLIQQKTDGKVTELTKAFSKKMTKQMLDMLRAAVDFLKSAIEKGDISKGIQEAIAGIESILAEYSGQEGGTNDNVSPPAADTTTDTKQPEAPANQATAEKTSDTDLDTTSQKSTPQDAAEAENPPQPDPLQNERDARETIRKGMLAARKAYPQLVDSDLGLDLEDIVYDMEDALATVPAEQRKGMVDSAIAAWIEENIAEKPAKATGTTDQKARRKAWRQAAQDKLNAAARAYINSGVPEAFYAVFQRGRIAPMPNILGLIRKRRDNGAKLTEKEIAIWQNESEWNGALKKSNYAGGGMNPLARAMIDLVMARQGEGQMPNTVADKLLPKITTASDMWEALAKELRTVTSGKNEDRAGFDPMDDPNYEPTDAEIAEWEAKQEAAAQKQDAQPHVTLADAYGYAVEAFAERSATTGEVVAIPPIAQKIGAVADFSDRILGSDMPDVRAAVNEEFRRNAAGQAIAEWQDSPDLSQTALGFLKFFRSTTPESLRETMEKLPIVDTGSALFSSPSEHLKSNFSETPNNYHYEPRTENRVDITNFVRLLEDAGRTKIELVDSPDLRPAIRRIEQAFGTTIRFFRSPGITGTGFVPRGKSGLVFINAETSHVSLVWTLAHELTHSIQNNPLAKPEQLRSLVNGGINSFERSLIHRHVLNHYNGKDFQNELEAFFMADAIAGESFSGLKRVEKSEDLTRSLADYFNGTPARLGNQALFSSPTQPGFSFDQTTDAGDKSQKGLDFTPSQAAPASPGRFRPKAMVEFAKPYRGPSGAELQAYEWKHTLQETVDKRGEDAAVRVSNWEEAATNMQTGREIVHQFHVTTKEGKSYVVSLESALKILGYTSENGKAAGPVRNLASMLRTRAQLAMEAEALRPAVEESNVQYARYEKESIALERERMPAPVFTVENGTPIMRIGALEKWGTLAGTPESFAKRSEYDLRQLESEWRTEEAKARAGGRGDYNVTRKLSDIEARIAKMDRKIQAAAAAGSSNEVDPASTAPSLFDTLPAGPLAKFNENTSKAYAAAPEDSKARENIGKLSAKREGMTTHGKVQNVPQAMMDFGMSGSFGTKDQPGLFASPSNQRAFDFGTTGSFDTKKQRGFDFGTIDTPANEAATSEKNDTPQPTEAQKIAGNYKVGRIRLGGMDISIENPAGSVRSGKDGSGKPWQVTMASHYGYVRGSQGKDGDHIDIFIQAGTPLDYAGPVFVVNQNNAAGEFDEHKAVTGPGITTEAQAKAEYLSNYSPGWNGAGSIARFESVDAFREWAIEKRRIGPAKPTDNQSLTVQPAAQIKLLEGITKAKIESELQAGKRSGNFSLVTDAKFRLAVLTGDPKAIYDTMLSEMGIKAPVSRLGDDLLIEVTTNQSMATLMRSLRGSFPVLAAMTPDGKQAIKIMGIPSSATRDTTPQPPIEPGTPEFRLLPKEDKGAIVKAKTQAKAAEKSGITDFGEKLGGARKDLSIKTGESSRPKKTNDKPGWFNRYEIGEVVAEMKPQSPLESYLSRSSGMPTGDVGRFIITDKRKTNYFGKPERATRQSFATREEAEVFIPMIEVSRNHRVRSEKVEGTGAQMSPAEASAMLEKDAAALKADRDHPGYFSFNFVESARNRLAQGSISQEDFDKIEATHGALAATFTPAERAPTPEQPQYRYGIWRTVSDRKRVQVVKQTFDTEKEAMEFMAKHAADIIETKTSWREELIVKPDNAVRKGPERRQGPATAEMFQDAFGFRGVEFGKWMRQAGDGKERQEVLNHAYDGLLDLAELIGIPPKGISLNGELGLAFGARGQGLSGAKAHYEPDYVVINLTKMSGAGSLAHEWIHALDHYLGRQDGRASSQLVKNKDGAMVLNPGAFEENAVSTRFSKDSKVREEVRNAFVKLMDTIMTKAVEYVEDSNNAERFVAGSRKALEDHLVSMRKDYTREPDPRWEKRRKVATTAQLEMFDSIADRLVNGQDLATDWRTIEGGKAKYGTVRWTNDTLEQLGELHKAITNRAGFDKERNGTLDNLRGYMSRYAERIKMLESAAASETKVKKVPTDFSMNAKRIDQGSASDYWNVPHEMLARGFSAYVEDRIANTGGTSDFLSYGSDNRLAKYRMFNVKPFPEGAEREAINERFDQLFDAIETEETDKGVRLFSSPTPDGAEFAAKAAAELAKHDELFRYRVSSKSSLRSVMADVFPRAQFRGDDTRPDERQESGADKRTAFSFTADDGKERLFYVYETDDSSPDVWIDVSRLTEGDAGSGIYAAVGNYAHNTGGSFIGDPAGLSEAATVRRSSAMLSLALRFGSTSFIEPSKSQLEGIPEKGIAPLEWKGNDAAKVRSLIQSFLSSLYGKFPSLKEYRYDFGRNQFVDRRGRSLDAERLEFGETTPPARAARAGQASLRRGILLQSLVSSEGGERSDVLGQLLDRSGSVKGSSLEGLFSSPTPLDPASPAQPDLFAAVNAPDATQKLGTVKVGSMNALGAYRTLTAKRDAGKTLTGKEEQQLLDAEQALGQKLAFDMDALKTPPTSEELAATDSGNIQNRIYSRPAKGTAGVEFGFKGEDGRIFPQSGWPESPANGWKAVPREKVLKHLADAESARGPAEIRGWMVRDLIKTAATMEKSFMAAEQQSKEMDDAEFAAFEARRKPAAVFGQNRQAGQDEMSRAGEIDRSGQISLLSSPASDNSAVAQALARMPDKYREVFAAVTAGKTPVQVAKQFGVTEKAVFNITNQVRARIAIATKAEQGTLKPKMQGDQFERGQPDLAEGGKAPFVAVDQIRNEMAPTPTISMEENHAAARRRLAANYEGEFTRLENMARDGILPTAEDIAIAKQIFKRETLSGGLEDPARRAKVALFQVAYRDDFGTEQGRALQMRRDEALPPAERNALHLAELLYEPSPDVQARMKAAKGDKAAQEAILKQWMDKIDAFHAEMKADGYDIKASMAKFQREKEAREAQEEAVRQQHDRLANAYQTDVDALQQQLAKATAAAEAAEAVGLASAEQIAQMKADAEAMAAKLKKTRQELSKIRSLEPGLVLRTALLDLTEAEKAAMESVINGGTYDNALIIGNLTEKQFDKLYSDFSNTMVKAQREAAAMAKQKMLEAPPVLMSSAMEAEINRSLGIVPLSELKARKAPISPEQVKQKPKKTPKAKPAEPVIFTPEQQAAIDAAFERFKNADPATWNTLFETEAKNLTPLIGQVAFEEFKGKALQPWRDRWQTEMDGIANPAGRISFEEWITKPSTKETAKRERDLFPQPINETTGSFDTTAPNREGSLFPQPINPQTGTWSETRPFTGQGELLREEINETTGTFDLNDPVAMMKVISAFSVSNASPGDKIMEFWKMSILSGIQTHVVNVSSNTLFTAYNLLPRRAAEATTNNLLSLIGLGSKESATFGEFQVMAKHLRNAASLGARLGLASWKTESRTFENYANAEALQLDFTGLGSERFAPALGGKLGKVMRSISFRAMTAADEFGKSFFSQLEAAAQAHRIARSEEKLRGPAYEARLAELLKPGSKAWLRSIDEAKRITFQEDVDGSRLQVINWMDQLAELVKKGRTMPWLGRPLTLFLPFVDTPLNIAKQAAIMSPLGMFLSVVDGTRALKRKIMRGDLTKDEADKEAALLYNRARLVQDVTNQTIALMVYFAVEAMTGDDDDDDLPFLTGSMEYRSSKQGERDNAYSVMPPQSIRIGGMVLSYKRFEPFATVLTSLADLSRETKRAGGMFKPGVASKWIFTFKDQMADKTFLQGFGNVMDAFENPDRFGSKLAGNIATGFIPNFIRQPIRNIDPVLRESRPRPTQGFMESVARSVGYSVVPQAAPERIDVWGNPIMRNRGEIIGNRATDSLIRIFDPTNITINPDIDPIDRWIYRFNMATADSKERVGIIPIGNRIQFSVPGEKQRRNVPLSVEEQTEANRNAGRAAREALGADWDSAELSTENATRIIQTVEQAQTAERARLKMEKLAAELPPTGN